MVAAATVLRDCRDRLARSGSNVIREVTQAAADPVPWRHYPEGEVYDPATHAQYFYHRHLPATAGEVEHGHFHTFLRAEGMPPGTRPLLLPELAVAHRTPPPEGAPI